METFLEQDCVIRFFEPLGELRPTAPIIFTVWDWDIGPDPDDYLGE